MSLEFEETVSITIKIEAIHEIDSINKLSEPVKKETVFIIEEPDSLKEELKWENSTETSLLPGFKVKTESVNGETDSEENEPNQAKEEAVLNNRKEPIQSPIWPAEPQFSGSEAASHGNCKQEQLAPSDCPALWVQCVTHEPLSEQSTSNGHPIDRHTPQYEATEQLTLQSSPTNEGRPYCCNICQKNFTRSSHLKRHIIGHSGEKLYTCAVCKIKFSRHDDLQRHMKKKHGESELVTKTIDETSKKLEEGIRLFSCHLCEKSYIRSSHLKRHVKSHSGEKLYNCHICKTKFTMHSDLKRHIKNHTGENPTYSCHICKKEFSQACNLKRHEQLHTGIKPYSCDICNKKFTELGHLKTHRRIHTGEKPCICDICEKKFTKVSDLRQHQITHTKAKPYSCEKCEKKFTRLRYLKIHKNNAHGEDPILGI